MQGNTDINQQKAWMRKGLWVFAAIGAVAMAMALPVPTLFGEHGSRAQRQLKAERFQIVAPKPRPQIRQDAMNELVAAMGSAPLVPPVSLALSGRVEAPGVEPVSVNVIAGARQIPAVVNGDVFEVQLTSVDARSMVVIEATRGSMRYRAILGTALQLRRQAGADRRVDIVENPSLGISPLSTALDFFLRNRLGGRLPVNDAELDDALLTLVPDDLPAAANALRAVAAGEVSLPSGFSSFDALIADRNAYRIFLNQNQVLRDNADANLRAMSLGSFSTEDLQRDWWLGGVQAKPGVTYAGFGVGQLMLRRLGGFSVHAPEFRMLPEYNATLTAQGQLDTVPVREPFVDSWIYSAGAINGDAARTLRRTTILHENYRKLFVGAKRQLWMRLRQQRSLVPSQPSDPPIESVVQSFWLASDLASSVQPAVPSQVLGRRAMPRFCMRASPMPGEPERIALCDYALHYLGENGVAVAEGLGPKVNDVLVPIAASGTAGLQWSIDGGGGLVTTDGAITVRYWRLGVSDSVGDMMVYLASTGSGSGLQTVAGRVVVLNGNSPVFFSPSDPVGSWHYGSFESAGVYAYNEYTVGVKDFDRFDRAADGTQIQTSQFWALAAPDAPADNVTRFRSSWVMSDGVMYDTRYRANVSTGEIGVSQFYSCLQAQQRGATLCAPSRVRYFKPVAKLGSRWYGIEEVYSTVYPDYVGPILHDRSPRPNFYEKVSP